MSDFLQEIGCKRYKGENAPGVCLKRYGIRQDGNEVMTEYDALKGYHDLCLEPCLRWCSSSPSPKYFHNTSFLRLKEMLSSSRTGNLLLEDVLSPRPTFHTACYKQTRDPGQGGRWRCWLRSKDFYRYFVTALALWCTYSTCSNLLDNHWTIRFEIQTLVKAADVIRVLQLK